MKVRLDGSGPLFRYDGFGVLGLSGFVGEAIFHRHGHVHLGELTPGWLLGYRLDQLAWAQDLFVQHFCTTGNVNGAFAPSTNGSHVALVPFHRSGPGYTITGTIGAWRIFHVHKDVVPGQTNTLTISADKPGTYLGQCAEYCGLSHANMRFRVIAQSPAEYEDWLAGQREGPTTELADAGAATDLFQKKFQCTNCHTTESSSVSVYGPNLTHLASRTTFASGYYELTRPNLIRWILDAPSMIPMQSENCRLPSRPSCVGMPSFTTDTPPGYPVMTRAEAEGRVAAEYRAYGIAFLTVAVPATVAVVAFQGFFGELITGRLPERSADIAGQALALLVPAAFLAGNRPDLGPSLTMDRQGSVTPGPKPLGTWNF